MANLKKFLQKVKAVPIPNMLSIFGEIQSKQIPYDASRDFHSLRKNTSPVVMEFFLPVVDAAIAYAAESLSAAVPEVYGLVKTRSGWAAEVEIRKNKRVVATYDKANTKLTAATFDPTVPGDQGIPMTDFPRIEPEEMAALCLLLIPLVCEMEAACATPTLQQDFAALAGISAPFALTENEKVAMYHCSIIADILDTVSVDLEMSGIPYRCDLSVPISGALICGFGTESLQHITITGKAQKAGVSMTMADAKALYANYLAGRTWTPAERMMIPTFSDDMPVMDEAIKIVKRITQTEHDTNPVVNVMWRGETSYGKSTGVAQAAAILNMPLLRMTCHPSMEAQDFRSSLIPVTEEESVDLDESAITPKLDQEEDDLVSKSLAYFAGLDQERRKAFLDAEAFFQDAMMDADMAYVDLLGFVPENTDSATACNLYLDVVSKIRQQALEAKLEAAEAEKTGTGKHKDNGTAFRHVASPYIKAMVNGYMVEIQECSRIRDSGVLVSINEFDRPGASIPLMTGAMAKRHPKAICVFTDNVGYASCRPVDPSVLRRMGMIIDSYDMPKEKLMARIRWNTKCQDNALLEEAYAVWQKVREFCQNNQITEGSVSATELERFVQALMYDGMDVFDEDLDDCIISKATSSIDDQKDIRAAVRALS